MENAIHSIWKIKATPLFFKRALLYLTILICGPFSLGKIQESEEMRPQWFNIEEIPYDKMWPDDKYWYPIMFKGQKFKARMLFEGKTKFIYHGDLFIILLIFLLQAWTPFLSSRSTSWTSFEREEGFYARSDLL